MLDMTGEVLDYADRIQLAKTVELADASLAVDDDARKICTGLNNEQLVWRPRPGRWSVAENLAHLRTTTEVFLPTVDAALEASRSKGLHSEGPFGLNPFGRFVVWRMDARPLVRMRAPRALQPRMADSVASELEIFLASQAAFRLRIEQAEGLNLCAWRFASPVAGYFRVNLLEFFSAFNAHSRRHLWQAKNVRHAMAIDRHQA
jgi:hypothetical protein